jgi:hypothetical protein
VSDLQTARIGPCSLLPNPLKGPGLHRWTAIETISQLVHSSSGLLKRLDLPFLLTGANITGEAIRRGRTCSPIQ